MNSRATRRLFAAAVFVAAIGGLTFPIGPAAAAEYEMTTYAVYVAEPESGVVRVSVQVAFLNTFSDPSGQASVFQEIKLGIHEHSTAVEAHDGSGALNVSTAVSGGVNVATITLRTAVGYQEAASLTLTYEIRDGDDPAIRIGEHLVSFPVWGFGTKSAVSVDLPADFEVRIDGDALQASVAADRAILNSGVIPDPTRWLSHVGAIRDPVYVTLQRAVPLEGGTADLQVRHWEDDPEWGEATLDLLVRALPRLEAAFGLPYAQQGPLVVTESVTGGGLGAEATNGELSVGFIEPPFTLLHQAAHVWANEELATDRWIHEGLASWAAARVAAELELATPYDPAAVSANLEADAFPLADWTSEDRSAEAEAWAYAASWSLTDEAARMAGEAGFQQALNQMAAGRDGYDPLTAEASDDAAAAAPADSHAYLDHLDAVTEEPVVEALAARILGAGTDELLVARASARTAYQSLLDLAGEWGDPDPVRAAMVEWRFPDAEAEIAVAAEWVIERNRLLFLIEQGGLTVPDRLLAAYRTHGGRDPAWAEIDAERAVVTAHGDVADRIAAGLDPIQRVGLLPGPSAEEQLAAAGTEFAGGDLRAAADQLASLDRDLGTATAGGLVRIVGVIVAVGAAALGVGYALRRRRTTTDYTPQP